MAVWTEWLITLCRILLYLLMGTGTALDPSGSFVLVCSLSLLNLACSLVYSFPHTPDRLGLVRKNVPSVCKCLALQKYPPEYQLFQTFTGTGQGNTCL
jgi:hypothetical protein